MYNIILISTLGLALLAVIYSLILFRLVSKKPSGSKKMADVSKALSDEIETRQVKNLKDFSLVAIVLFTALLYALGWQVAVSFLSGAVLFILADYYLMLRTSDFFVQLAEAAKPGLSDAFRLNYNFALSSVLFLAGLGIIATSGVYFGFRNDLALYALALSGVLASIFSWRTNRLAYFGGYIALLAVTIVLGKQFFPNFQNAEIFPLALAAFTIVATVIGSFFTRIDRAAKETSAAFYQGLGVFALITLAGFYFGSKYIFAGNGLYDTNKFAIVLAIGLILAGLLALVRELAKIMPALSVGIALLAANYLAGTYGMSLTALGILALWPLALSTNLFSHQAKNAEIIAELSEMPAEALERTRVLQVTKIRSSGYSVAVAGFSALLMLVVFVSKFTNFSFSAVDSKVISGLLFGGSLAYLLNSEIFVGKILRISTAVLAAILAGFTLGPVFLAGALAGAILANILVIQSESGELLLAAIVSVLISAMIANQFSLTIRMIIAGGVVVLLLAYLIFGKLGIVGGSKE